MHHLHNTVRIFLPDLTKEEIEKLKQKQLGRIFSFKLILSVLKNQSQSQLNCVRQFLIIGILKS